VVAVIGHPEARRRGRDSTHPTGLSLDLDDDGWFGLAGGVIVGRRPFVVEALARASAFSVAGTLTGSTRCDEDESRLGRQSPTSVENGVQGVGMIDSTALLILLLIVLAIMLAAPLAGAAYLVARGSSWKAALAEAFIGLAFGVLATILTPTVYGKLSGLPQREHVRMGVTPVMVLAAIAMLCSPALGVLVGVLAEGTKNDPDRRRRVWSRACAGLGLGLGLLAIGSLLVPSEDVAGLLTMFALVAPLLFAIGGRIRRPGPPKVLDREL
jgi:hypothetical protein